MITASKQTIIMRLIAVVKLIVIIMTTVNLSCIIVVIITFELKIVYLF